MRWTWTTPNGAVHGIDTAAESQAAGSGPQVVLEADDGPLADGIERNLRSVGYDVVRCHGAGGQGVGTCPLPGTGSCPLVEEAEGVVSALNPDRDVNRDVQSASRFAYPDKPFLLAARTGRKLSASLLFAEMADLGFPSPRNSESSAAA